ncbi:MAG: hypothetical protein ACOCX1_00260 [Fimbriimonadaceae bacterium]
MRELYKDEPLLSYGDVEQIAYDVLAPLWTDGWSPQLELDIPYDDIPVNMGPDDLWMAEFRVFSQFNGVKWDDWRAGRVLFDRHTGLLLEYQGAPRPDYKPAPGRMEFRVDQETARQIALDVLANYGEGQMTEVRVQPRVGTPGFKNLLNAATPEDDALALQSRIVAYYKVYVPSERANGDQFSQHVWVDATTPRALAYARTQSPDSFGAAEGDGESVPFAVPSSLEHAGIEIYFESTEAELTSGKVALLETEDGVLMRAKASRDGQTFQIGEKVFRTTDRASASALRAAIRDSRRGRLPNPPKDQG